jgi:hypothetical protein
MGRHRRLEHPARMLDVVLATEAKVTRQTGADASALNTTALSSAA